jgi:hypothetical protein
MGKPLLAGVGAFGTPPALDRANGVVSGTFAAVGPGRPFAIQGPFNVLIYASIVTALTTTANSGAFAVASGTNLAPGAAINSANVPPGTTIATIAGAAGTLAFPSISLRGNLNPAAAVITGLSQTAGLVGATVTHPALPAGTTVPSIGTPFVAGNGNVPAQLGSVNLSAAPTAVVNQAELVFALTNSSVTAGVDNAAIFTGGSVVFVGTVQLERSFDGGLTWVLCNVGGQGALAVWNAGTPVSAVVGEAEAGVAYRLNCVAYASGTINYRVSTTGATAVSLAIGSAI